MAIAAIATACLSLTGVLSYAVLIAPAGPPARDSGGSAKSLPHYFQTPDFTLTNRWGKAMSSNQLKGKVWVADFFFTRCKLVCPILSKRMEAVRDKLKEQGVLGPVQLVSVTVDPVHDTPEFLRPYATKHKAGKNWHFLTGDRANIYPIIRDGFKLSVEATPGNKQAQFQHSARLALVDQDGMIRRYYPGLEKSTVAKVVADARRLLDEHTP